MQQIDEVKEVKEEAQLRFNNIPAFKDTTTLTPAPVPPRPPNLLDFSELARKVCFESDLIAINLV